MSNSLFAKNLAIHFTNRIENEDYYIYDVELENITNDGVDYNMEDLYCSNGTNVLDLDTFNLNLISGKTLLHTGHIVVGNERVSGVVAFEKISKTTNDTPMFEYDELMVNTYSEKINI